MRMWPTPYGVSGNHGPDGNEFSTAVRNWATPRSTDGEKGGPNCKGGRGDPILPGQAAQWATPQARDWRTETAEFRREHFPTLGRQVLQPTGEESLYPTPTSSRRHGLQSHGRNVVAARLNPLFVEWLMGWPLGWTACAALGTESFPSWLRLHSSLLRNALGSR